MQIHPTPVRFGLITPQQERELEEAGLELSELETPLLTKIRPMDKLEMDEYARMGDEYPPIPDGATPEKIAEAREVKSRMVERSLTQDVSILKGLAQAGELDKGYRKEHLRNSGIFLTVTTRAIMQTPNFQPTDRLFAFLKDGLQALKNASAHLQ